jgi:hypothetical protein
VNGSAKQSPFVVRDAAIGSASLAPMLPLTLESARSLDVFALVDTGAAVNVLPYDVGLQLGLVWDRQTTSVRLSGNLASVEARVALLSAQVPGFPPVRLAFDWTKQDAIPILLGQVNFFLEFDVCFFRSRATFEVQPKR